MPPTNRDRRRCSGGRRGRTAWPSAARDGPARSSSSSIGDANLGEQRGCGSAATSSANVRRAPASNEPVRAAAACEASATRRRSDLAARADRVDEHALRGGRHGAVGERRRSSASDVDEAADLEQLALDGLELPSLSAAATTCRHAGDLESVGQVAAGRPAAADRLATTVSVAGADLVRRGPAWRVRPWPRTRSTGRSSTRRSAGSASSSVATANSSSPMSDASLAALRRLPGPRRALPLKCRASVRRLLELGDEALDRALLARRRHRATRRRCGRRAAVAIVPTSPLSWARTCARSASICACALAVMRVGLGLRLCAHLGDDLRALLLGLLADARRPRAARRRSARGTQHPPPRRPPWPSRRRRTAGGCSPGGRQTFVDLRDDVLGQDEHHDRERKDLEEDRAVRDEEVALGHC